MNYLKTFTKGILKENPVLVLLLGMCPTLALTTGAKSALGMGISVIFVLLGSNVVISLLKRFIGKSIRIPAYIVVIAGFVTIIELLMKAFLPSLYQSLGLYLSLIVVNCIILGRAELFASRNNVLASALDAIGMGIGFTLALFVLGSIREILGSGCWFEIPITANFIEPMTIFVLPAGGFFVLGCVIAVVNKINSKKKAAPAEESGCASCPAHCLGCNKELENN